MQEDRTEGSASPHETGVRVIHGSVRYEVVCRDCSLDTYGGEEYLQIGKEHAAECPGHRVVVVRKSFDTYVATA